MTPPHNPRGHRASTIALFAKVVAREAKLHASPHAQRAVMRIAALMPEGYPDRTTDRERDAIELLDRIYNGRTGGAVLYDDCMTVEWMYGEIAAYIRKYGSFGEQLNEWRP